MIRGCDLCDKSDDGPRHVVAGRPGKAPTTRHFECCASAGCEICTDQLTSLEA